MASYPKSEGYIAIDVERCAGCLSCMLACSLAHEGEENLVLSRIQVVQNIFETYPEDVIAGVCRQCARPLCVEACPTGACYIDTAHGNVRVIDETRCDGCRLCLEACPFVPRMVIWNVNKNVAVKCDLCSNAPYWSEPGGVDGKQACVEVCPMKVIRLVKKAPQPAGTSEAGAK